MQVKDLKVLSFYKRNNDEKIFFVFRKYDYYDDGLDYSKSSLPEPNRKMDNYLLFTYYGNVLVTDHIVIAGRYEDDMYVKDFHIVNPSEGMKRVVISDSFDLYDKLKN